MPKANDRVVSQGITRKEFLRRGLMLAAAVPMTQILAACGSEGPAATTAGATGSSAESTKDFSGQTLRFLAAQPQAGAAELLKPLFEERTGATVEVTVVPYTEIQSKATLDVQSGANEFDVFQYWYTSVGALAEAGVFADITDLIEDNAGEIQPDDFIPAIYDPYTLHHGRRYGLPFDGDYHILFCNMEIFERAGVEIPTTWDEYTAVAEEITGKLSGEGIYGAALLGRKTAFDIGSSFFNRLATFGGQAIVDGRSGLDSAAAIQAATAMADVAPHALPTPLETGFDTALPQWLAGKVGMMEFWTDLGTFSQDQENSNVVDKWEAVPLPTGPDGPQATALNAGWAFAISANAQNPELALEFIKFATSAELNEQLITTTGSGIDPNRRSTLNSGVYKEFAPKVQPVAAQVVENSMSWPTVPQAPELITILNDELALMLQGTKSPEQAVETIHTRWNEVLA